MSKPSSSFVSNVLKLTTGSMFAQGLGIIVAPILTRLFAPEAFGVAAVFMSITVVIGALACLRYELSIMLPETDEEAANLLGVSVCSVLVISFLTALLIYLASEVITSLFNAPQLEKYLWMIPIAVLIEGFFWAFNYWDSRTKQFGRLSIARVLSSLVAQTTKLGAGFAGFVSGGALIGTTILGNFISTGFLGCKIWHNHRALFQRSVSLKGLIEGIKRHKKFPIYSTWSALLNSTSHQLPALILAVYFSPKVVGYFALGRAVLTLPMKMLGTSIGQVFYQKAADAHNRTGDLPKVVENVFKGLVSLGIFPILMLALIGKEVFIVAFGARWAEAGVYVQILGLLTYFKFISSPISTIYIVLEKQRAGLVFDIILLITSTISLISGGLMGDPRMALIFFSGSGIIAYCMFLIWLLSCAGVRLSRAFGFLIKYASISTPMLGITLLAKWSSGASPLWVASIGGASSLLYYFVILKLDQDLQSPFRILCQRLGLAK